MTQAVAATTATKKESSKKNSAMLKLEPNPQAKQAAKEKLAETVQTPAAAATATATATAAPVETKAEAKAEKPAKAKGKKSSKPKETKDKGGLLELGAGFSIKHKPRSAYSTLYQVVAKKGSFAKVAEALGSKKYDVGVKAQADELLSSMLVPVDKLEEWCRADESWQEHAKKKTEALRDKAEGGKGSKQAKSILENKARCADGKKWSGNIPEMISTCVGYYNFLIKSKRSKKPPKKCNKNVKKFQEAKVVFRRFDWEDKNFVMMFPEEHVDTVRKAIETSRGVNEEAEEK